MARINDRNLTALAKGSERYVFVWEDSQFDGLVNACVRWAADPKLTFTTYDAAVMIKHARKTLTSRGKEIPKEWNT